MRRSSRLLGALVSLAGLTRCDIRVAGKQKWRKWEKHFTRLALPSSTGDPLSDPALRRDLAAAQWFRACELHGGAPVTLGEGEGGGRGGRGEVGSVLHLSFCRVQHGQLACLNVAGNSSLGFKMAHCPQNVEILKCRMSKMPPVRVEFKSRESQDKRKDRDLSRRRSRASRCGVTPTVIGPAIAWVPQMIYFERLIRRRLLGGAPLTSSSSSASSLFPQASA